jgi:hypothetical protein
MKRSLKYMSGTVLGLILVLSAVPGHAQDGAKIKTSIPFNLVVGNKELKAGDYVIQRVGETGSLIIRSEDGGDQQMVYGVRRESKETGNHERLIFHRYNNEYFLAQIWLSGDEDGHELIRGAQEKKTAANPSASEQAVAGQ